PPPDRGRARRACRLRRRAGRERAVACPSGRLCPCRTRRGRGRLKPAAKGGRAMSAEPALADSRNAGARVAGLVRRARAAMEAYENRDQARIDEAVTAVAWSIYKPENARMLAELAV